MALRAQIVHLIGRDVPDKTRQIGRVGQVPVMQFEMRIGDMRILIDVVDTGCIEQRGTTLDAVNLIPLRQQELRK